MLKLKIDKELIENYPLFINYARKLANKRDDPYDIVHECILYILNLGTEKQEEILPYIKYYTTQMIKFSCIYKTSPYQRKYNSTPKCENFDIYRLEAGEEMDEQIATYDIKKFNHKKLNTILESDIFKYDVVIDILFKKCSWFDRTIFLLYCNEFKSLRKLSAEVNIPVSTIHLIINNTKKIIKENIKNYEK